MASKVGFIILPVGIISCVILLQLSTVTAGKPCPEIVIPKNSTLSGNCSGDVPPGITCTFTCPPGFALRGKKDNVCQGNSTWNRGIPRCENTCATLDIDDTMTANGTCTGAKPGDKCRFTCREGYVMRGNNEVTCKEDLSWSDGPPLCLNACIKLYPDKNMKSSGTCDDAKVGDKCNFTCDEGYVLVGKGVLTCLKNFQWSDFVPQCEQTCPKLMKPANGAISGQCEAAQISDRCYFDCLPGFSRVGNWALKCLEGGSWDSSPPTCVFSGCNGPFEGSSPNGPTWLSHCAGLKRECKTLGDSTYCGDCLPKFKPGPAPNDPCVSGATARVARFITAVLALGLPVLLSNF